MKSTFQGRSSPASMCHVQGMLATVPPVNTITNQSQATTPQQTRTPFSNVDVTDLAAGSRGWVRPLLYFHISVALFQQSEAARNKQLSSILPQLSMPGFCTHHVQPQRTFKTIHGLYCATCRTTIDTAYHCECIPEWLFSRTHTRTRDLPFRLPGPRHGRFPRSAGPGAPAHTARRQCRLTGTPKHRPAAQRPFASVAMHNCSTRSVLQVRAIMLDRTPRGRLVIQEIDW